MILFHNLFLFLVLLTHLAFQLTPLYVVNVFLYVSTFFSQLRGCIIFCVLHFTVIMLLLHQPMIVMVLCRKVTIYFSIYQIFSHFSRIFLKIATIAQRPLNSRRSRPLNSSYLLLISLIFIACYGNK
jgi:hypothetical protein